VEGQAWIEEALALYRELGDEHHIAATLFAKGLLAFVTGDICQAQECQTEAIRLFRGLRDEDGMGLALFLGGILYRFGRDYNRARENLEESLAHFRQLDARYLICNVVNELGHMWLGLGDYDRARASFEEVMRTGQEEGFTIAVGHAMLGLGVEAAVRDEPERAARLMGASEEILEAIGSATPLRDYPHYVATVRARLSESVLASRWAEGRAMTEEQAIAYALERTNVLDHGSTLLA
jgi:tetratricopeptide (TPR) repeat protein